MSKILVPLSEQERYNTRDMLDGCLNRIMITDDLSELITLFCSAFHYIDMLFQDSRLRILFNVKEKTIKPS